MKVLARLPAVTDSRLLVDASGWDDAGVIALDESRALVQSVDFFPPVVDDPWWFGRIAAANALSDLYAMGATPLSVLNLVVFPTDKLPLEVLSTILEGGADAVAESGAALMGGHSVVDEGVKYGLSVTGLVRPGEQVTNAGARAGDVLFLTKALGTGAVTTALRKDQASETALQAACEQMGRLNRPEAEAMVAVGVHAATDVTGYGLAGHAGEMAAASGVDMVLQASALPALEEAHDLLARGCVSGGAVRTREHLAERLVVASGVDEADVLLATDSETSGGLLIAVAPDRAEALEVELSARGVTAARVGGVREGQGRLSLEP